MKKIFLTLSMCACVFFNTKAQDSTSFSSINPTPDKTGAIIRTPGAVTFYIGDSQYQDGDYVFAKIDNGITVISTAAFPLSVDKQGWKTFTVNPDCLVVLGVVSGGESKSCTIRVGLSTGEVFELKGLPGGEMLIEVLGYNSPRVKQVYSKYFL